MTDTPTDDMAALCHAFAEIREAYKGSNPELFAAHIAAAVAIALDDGVPPVDLVEHIAVTSAHAMDTYRKQRILKQAQRMVS